MKLNYNLLGGAAVACAVSLTTWAQPELPRAPLGADKEINYFNQVEIKNFQDESLGRIMDLGIDLVNGRIVEVLVTTDSSLGDTRIVAIPPAALFPDLAHEIYRINMSVEDFKLAPAIDLDKWVDSGRSDRIAAAYRHFGQEPYFLEEGLAPDELARRPRVPLGYVERSSKILNLPVGNFQNEQFGKVWSMTLDIPAGRIRSVVVLAEQNFQRKSIIPAMALSFNAARDGLLLDDSKVEFEAEPRLVFVEAAYGQRAYYKEEPYTGLHTKGRLEQGASYRDIDRTVRINLNIRAAKINNRNVEVGTINGRVTVRGWVASEEDKRRIGEIAIAASTLELVDNQLMVGQPTRRN